ncbi:hypothetical protein NX059_000987 [Plenodomus lindquistii]|nr:hypothetical protein NX059_000987 [Plenodomus lindquistii]
MSTSSDAADLERALAMSMEEPTTDDQDEDLRLAIALSKQHTEQRPSPNSSVGDANHVIATVKQPHRAPAVVTPGTPVPCPSMGLGGIDRKAMEEERLARLNKRKRDPSPNQPTKRQARTTESTLPPKSSMPCPTLSTVTLQYPKGTIKRTFATKYPRTNDITIDELLEAPQVNIAVISSFMWEAEWLHEKLNPVNVKQIWVMNAKDKDVQARWVREMKDTKVPNLRLHFPPMQGVFRMHSKYLLLFGDHKLRLAIPTANMTRIDWGEVANDWQPGVMENSVFLIDLPRLGHGMSADKSKLTEFGREFVYFLEQQKTPQNVIDGVLKFDFSQTAHLAFVHSIGGPQPTEDAHPTGLLGLAHSIRSLRLGNLAKLEIDYATSSLGAVNDSFLHRVHLAAQGMDPNASVVPANVRDKIRIFFPTKETVEQSIGGPDCGGIISFSRKYYNAPGFPRECLRDHDSTRRGMLSHNKLLFARGCRADGKRVAWVYVGSANLSESAWGSQRVLKSGELGSLNMKNWECGVVVSVPEETMAELDSRGSAGTTLPPMGVFESIVEVPFHHPGRGYGRRQPWSLEFG